MNAFIVLMFSFQLGVLPLGDVFIYTLPEYLFIDNTGYTEFTVTAKYNGFYLKGSAQTYIWHLKDNVTFTPYQGNYGIEIGWINHYINVGVKYNCIHPIVPYYFLQPPIYQWEAGFLDIFLKIKGDIKIDF